MDENQANPSVGADDAPLSVSDAAERFRGMLDDGEPTVTENATDGGEEPQATEVEAVEAEAEEIGTQEVETAAEEPAEIEEQPKGRYRVKINGEERLVTFDELRKGYMLEADYRQKTAQIAEQRRQAEAERQHYQNQLKAFIPALQAQVQDKFANVDWVKLSQEDPAGYVQMRAEFDQYSSRLQMAFAEQQRLEQQSQAEREKALQEQLQSEAKRLTEKLPILADPEKAKAFRSELKTYLTSEGYTPEEIAGLADHRAAIIAHKAMLYDKAQKAKTVAQQKAVNVPKVQKPGTATRVDPKQVQVSAAHERFQKSGKPSDLAAVFLARGIG